MSYAPLEGSFEPSPSDPVLESSPSWDSLRKQARQLENDIEAKLASFAKTVAIVSNGNARSGSATEIEVEELLNKFNGVITMMSQLVDQSRQGSSTSMMHILQRHRDIFYDYSKEFKKTKANIVTAREHAELLSSIHEDISTYRTSPQGSDYYLTERSRIDYSHQMTDDIINQAQDTKDDLRKQRNMLFNVTKRLTAATARIPFLHSLLTKIQHRKQRDVVILGLLIGFCIIFIILYLLG